MLRSLPFIFHRLSALWVLFTSDPAAYPHSRDILAIFQRCVEAVLEKHLPVPGRDPANSAAAPEPSNHYHVTLVSTGECSAGSLRESLALALEVILMRAFVRVLGYVDTNFNLLIAAEEQHVARLDAPVPRASPSDLAELFFTLAQCPSVLDAKIVADRSRPLSGRGASEPESAVNKGTGMEPVVARMPWSWRLAEMIESFLEAEAGDAMGVQDEDDAFESQDGDGVSPGEDVAGIDFLGKTR